MGAPKSDFWRVGIVPAPIESWCDPAVLAAKREQIVWLPDPGPWRDLADPFGLRRENATHVFVEAFDYRTKHAVIEHHELGPDLSWRGSEVVLSRPYHLSYPYIIEHENEVFMVPESHRANEIALYRAVKFPGEWKRETVLLTGLPAAETSVFRHDGRWWIFFTLVGPHARDQRELHAAFADKLTGPWRLHSQNPLVDDLGGGRPGGTPFVDADGYVTLPVQDCRTTYGGGLRFRRFTILDTDRVVSELLPGALTGSLVSSTHQDGLHTLARCGDLSLLDVKSIVRSSERRWIDWKRRLQRIWQ